MLHSRAGYRSARPILFITHIRLATHGRSIQKCQLQTSTVKKVDPRLGLQFRANCYLRGAVRSVSEAGLSLASRFLSVPQISINQNGQE